MALIVQKYGGTSVGSVERIRAVAEQIVLAKQEGNQLVVVLSAMGESTDVLIKLAAEIDAEPNGREMDMLVSTGEQVSVALLTMALQQKGCKAISMTGWQAGIATDEKHQDARISHIRTDRIHEWLDKGYVVVVAGYQGLSESGQITTLGRGGSDTSAVALAARLRAELCEIHTDVTGVYTADPRLVPEAQKLEQIPYEHMLELAEMGAAVLHPRSVKEAIRFQVPLVVRSSFSSEEGTRVGGSAVEKAPISFWGIAHQEEMAVLSIKGKSVEEAGNLLAEQFDTMEVESDSVDFKSNTLQYSLPVEELKSVTAILQDEGDRLGVEAWECEKDLTKVTIVRAEDGPVIEVMRKLARIPYPIRWLKPVNKSLACLTPAPMSKAVMQSIHSMLGMNAGHGAISARS
ncbi:aspartate kinase [Brevibacillus choshinensis]|uniref:Aspartokinase n=1 Tax=Brevibacillus choshinensis TaxID=54911 RepID=A0ABX7FLW6_BRECH|nr:aspartate kinase [Brevibacillus choshinensis]QRG66642.1 aspartate kinase [Brevibacillus choshinensis]